jgi:hypothetical protein
MISWNGKIIGFLCEPEPALSGAEGGVLGG